MSIGEHNCLGQLIKFISQPCRKYFVQSLKKLKLNSEKKRKIQCDPNKFTIAYFSLYNNKYSLDTFHIPLELASDILSRLPTKEVIRYQSVCKSWRNEISRTRFIEAHTLNSDKADYNNGSYVILRTSCYNLKLPEWFCLDFGSNSTELVVKKLNIPSRILRPRFIYTFGSCYGLLCLIRDISSLPIPRFWLFNPATGSHKITPCLIPEHVQHHGVKFGFGYDCISDDYKILCLVCYYHGHESYIEAWIYSSKSNSWKIIQPLDYHQSYPLSIFSFMIFCNNALHWENSMETIMSFDLGTQKFYEIPIPPYTLIDYRVASTKLVGLRGCLHYVTHRWPNANTQYYEIWVMTEYRVQWTKLIHIDIDNLHAFYCPISFKLVLPLPYAYSKDGKEVLIGYGSSITFVKLKELKVPDMLSEKLEDAMPFDCFSLVSPVHI